MPRAEASFDQGLRGFDDPGATAGFVQTAGIFGRINLSLKTVDAVLVLDLFGAEVEPAVPADGFVFDPDGEVVIHPVADEHAVAFFTADAGSDQLTVLERDILFQLSHLQLQCNGYQ